METLSDERRPVLVVSQTEAIPVLSNVVVAPVTSMLRSIHDLPGAPRTRRLLTSRIDGHAMEALPVVHAQGT